MIAASRNHAIMQAREIDNLHKRIAELEAQIAKARENVLEEAAKAVETVKDKSGVNADGRTWLQRATKHDCAEAIRALKEKETAFSHAYKSLERDAEVLTKLALGGKP
jgi:hypothetical protein